MQKQMYLCDCCKGMTNGVLMDEAYRLNSANFTRLRLELMAEPTGPLPRHTAEEYIICNVCKDTFFASLNAVIDPLKANQTEMRG